MKALRVTDRIHGITTVLGYSKARAHAPSERAHLAGRAGAGAGSHVRVERDHAAPRATHDHALVARPDPSDRPQAVPVDPPSVASRPRRPTTVAAPAAVLRAPRLSSPGADAATSTSTARGTNVEESAVFVDFGR